MTTPDVRDVTLRGIRHPYLTWESSAARPRTLVLLHGLVSHAWTWAPAAGGFLDRYRVVAFEQRGHGDAGAAPADGYTTSEYVADVTAFLDHLGLERPPLIGHSMGGHIGMALAARQPDRLSCLANLDMVPRIETGRHMLTRAQQERDGKPTYATVDEAIDWLQSMNARASRDAHRVRAEHGLLRLPDGRWTWKYDLNAYLRFAPDDLWPELPRIRIPVLIIRGALSYMGDRAEFERMAAAIPGAELQELAECGHSVPYDQPERFLASARAFLERADVRPGRA